ncbi:TPA: His-Xaa-Ser system protein HxsD [Pseudomonas aeruginosa]|uniref:His-Xaa-Ser system protein HxsD n=1 Tax=Gammaproteobacteria TaxID=1236 RepID=UPI00053EFAE1|nr:MULTISPECIES: His-Xaa-Ser system protein HxsD [Gammaproteobacteria]EIU5456218.1 His-Xaa-Ser system protein HxsD [Pseudomonas aeruginosa]EIU5540767.1 His-Xaa-Ser system protein HxsD [Pseudomonas aeruginosa]EKW4491778.1 His-Xaa-Ser system protein HxsD [Pseudomonas aeruginosa]EKY0074018.1 His-Xaa-Ser system protein HxsD [Pseudomonas aeruginosa]EKY0498391.1 His-Xaa-Ser system protein HxsD [Pseudomonas aeruginosa]
MAWQVILQLDEQAYSPGVVQRAAYSIARDFVTEVRMQDQRTTLLVTPSPTSANAATFCPEQVKSLLLQQLNDFVLRERIQLETAGIREVLIRTALVGGSY